MLTNETDYDKGEESNGIEHHHGESLQYHIDLYEKKGFSFFPLRKKSKKPLSDWAVYQTRPPTKEEVGDWQAKGVLDQVAISTGGISGIIILDEDAPPEFQSWLFEHGYNLPRTPTVETSSYVDDLGATHTKRHYYFKHPGGKIKNMIKKIPGADIKADGGYVVAPPSIHPSGARYRWIEFLGLDDLAPVDPPTWLAEFFKTDINEPKEAPPRLRR
jgi:putative DNA primase/helicase